MWFEDDDPEQVDESQFTPVVYHNGQLVPGFHMTTNTPSFHFRTDQFQGDPDERPD